MYLLLLVIGLYPWAVDADYPCLCNYKVEDPVYSGPEVSSTVLGYLYEFDCKALFVGGVEDGSFYVVQFEKKVSAFSTKTQNTTQHRTQTVSI